MNELALFAGAGGGILGGKLLGWRTVCAVEWEPYPASVLCARQNDGILAPFPIWDDVCTFDGKPWQGIVDVVSGGFPGQDISSAGGGLELPVADQDSGKRWRGLLGKYDPATHSLKTAQCSLFGDLIPSSVTLPRWGLMQGGELYQRQTLVRPISEREYGLWPTVTATANQLAPSMQSRYANPIWPTPNAGNKKWGGTMQEWGGSKNWVRKEMPEFASGQLNPTWVEWLMGWPLGWTDLKLSATDKYQRWQQQHSNF